MKGTAEQEWANRAKTIRAAVRLKYSLLADGEINRIMDDEKKKYFKQIMKGVLPAPLSLGKVLGE